MTTLRLAMKAMITWLMIQMLYTAHSGYFVLGMLLSCFFGSDMGPCQPSFDLFLFLGIAMISKHVEMLPDPHEYTFDIYIVSLATFYLVLGDSLRVSLLGAWLPYFYMDTDPSKCLAYIALAMIVPSFPYLRRAYQLFWPPVSTMLYNSIRMAFSRSYIYVVKGVESVTPSPSTLVSPLPSPPPLSPLPSPLLLLPPPPPPSPSPSPSPLLSTSAIITTVHIEPTSHIEPTVTMEPLEKPRPTMVDRSTQTSPALNPPLSTPPSLPTSSPTMTDSGMQTSSQTTTDSSAQWEQQSPKAMTKYLATEDGIMSVPVKRRLSAVKRQEPSRVRKQRLRDLARRVSLTKVLDPVTPPSASAPRPVGPLGFSPLPIVTPSAAVPKSPVLPPLDAIDSPPPSPSPAPRSAPKVVSMLTPPNIPAAPVVIPAPTSPEPIGEQASASPTVPTPTPAPEDISTAPVSTPVKPIAAEEIVIKQEPVVKQEPAIKQEPVIEQEPVINQEPVPSPTIVSPSPSVVPISSASPLPAVAPTILPVVSSAAPVLAASPIQESPAPIPVSVPVPVSAQALPTQRDLTTPVPTLSLTASIAQAALTLAQNPEHQSYPEPERVSSTAVPWAVPGSWATSPFNIPTHAPQGSGGEQFNTSHIPREVWGAGVQHTMAMLNSRKRSRSIDEVPLDTTEETDYIFGVTPVDNGNESMDIEMSEDGSDERESAVAGNFTGYRDNTGGQAIQTQAQWRAFEHFAGYRDSTDAESDDGQAAHNSADLSLANEDPDFFRPDVQFAALHTQADGEDQKMENSPDGAHLEISRIEGFPLFPDFDAPWHQGMQSNTVPTTQHQNEGMLIDEWSTGTPESLDSVMTDDGSDGNRMGDWFGHPGLPPALQVPNHALTPAPGISDSIVRSATIEASDRMDEDDEKLDMSNLASSLPPSPEQAPRAGSTEPMPPSTPRFIPAPVVAKTPIATENHSSPVLTGPSPGSHLTVAPIPTVPSTPAPAKPAVPASETPPPAPPITPPVPTSAASTTRHIKVPKPRLSHSYSRPTPAAPPIKMDMSASPTAPKLDKRFAISNDPRPAPNISSLNPDHRPKRDLDKVPRTKTIQVLVEEFLGNSGLPQKLLWVERGRPAMDESDVRNVEAFMNESAAEAEKAYRVNEANMIQLMAKEEEARRKRKEKEFAAKKAADQAAFVKRQEAKRAKGYAPCLFIPKKKVPRRA